MKARLFELIFRRTNEGAVAMNGEGSILAVNPAAEKLLSRPAAAMVGKRLAEFLPAPALDLGRAESRADLLARGRIEGTVERPVDGSGAKRLAYCLHGFFDKQGSLSGAALLFSPEPEESEPDGSGRVAEALRRQASRSTDGMVWVRGDRVIYVNEAFVRLSGLAAAEVVGSEVSVLDRFLPSLGEAVLPDSRSRFPERLEVKTELGGSEYMFELSALALPEEAGDLQLTVRDVTSRAEYESRLAASESKYRLLVDLARQAIVSIDADGVIGFANPYTESILGRPPASLLHRSVLTLADPDWAPALSELLLQGREEPVEQEEVRLLRADGKSIECMLNAGAIFDRQGRFLGYTIFITDLSETKKLREQLYLAEKMSAIGRLAGGIAHEFNNIHAAVQGYAELLLQDKTQLPQAQHDLQAVRQLIRRASHITEQLLVFARNDAPRKELVNLIDLVDANAKIVYKEYAQEDIVLAVKHRRELAPVRINAGRIGQAIMEMIMNAHDAIVERGSGERKIEIETGADEERVFVRVSDTGRGVAPESEKSIFEPFYTTKGALGGSVIPGTGLGLSVAHAIVSDHRGAIEVANNQDGGASFTMWLPREEEPNVPDHISVANHKY